MIKKEIRNLHSNISKRFCDVVIDGDKVYLEIKSGKKYEKIPWEDVVYQVEAAKAVNR